MKARGRVTPASVSLLVLTVFGHLDKNIDSFQERPHTKRPQSAGNRNYQVETIPGVGHTM